MTFNPFSGEDRCSCVNYIYNDNRHFLPDPWCSHHWALVKDYEETVHEIQQTRERYNFFERLFRFH